jgi:hypothetical protein
MSTYVISTESIDLIKVTSCLVPSVDRLDLFKISIDISDINVDTEWWTKRVHSSSSGKCFKNRRKSTKIGHQQDSQNQLRFHIICQRGIGFSFNELHYLEKIDFIYKYIIWHLKVMFYQVQKCPTLFIREVSLCRRTLYLQKALIWLKWLRASFLA